MMCMKYEVTLDYLNVFQLPICRVDFKLLFKKKKKKKRNPYPLDLCGIAVVNKIPHRSCSQPK